jgi:hypothetical protein
MIRYRWRFRATAQFFDRADTRCCFWRKGIRVSNNLSGGCRAQNGLDFCDDIFCGVAISGNRCGDSDRSLPDPGLFKHTPDCGGNLIRLYVGP